MFQMPCIAENVPKTPCQKPECQENVCLLNNQYPLPGLPWWLSGKNTSASAGDMGSIPGLGRSLEKEMATHSSILAWEIHGQRSLAG